MPFTSREEKEEQRKKTAFGFAVDCSEPLRWVVIRRARYNTVTLGALVASVQRVPPTAATRCELL
jgi:hypothetical protein